MIGTKFQAGQLWVLHAELLARITSFAKAIYFSYLSSFNLTFICLTDSDTWFQGQKLICLWLEYFRHAL